MKKRLAHKILFVAMACFALLLLITGCVGEAKPSDEEDPNQEPEAEPSKITYTVAWYDADGNRIKPRVSRKGKEGEEVTVKESDKEVYGYIFNDADDRNVISSTLNGEDVVLKLYFTEDDSDKVFITIRYVDEAGFTVKLTTKRVRKSGRDQVSDSVQAPEGYEIVRIEHDVNGTIEDGMEVTVIVKEIDSSHTHSYTTEVVEPTCTTEGVTTYTCTSCGHTYTEKTPALGHNFGTWTTIQSATCAGDGSETSSCTRCGQTESRNIPATGHAWGSWNITVPAGPGVEGKETRICANDSSHVEIRPIDALPVPEPEKVNFEELTVVDNDQCIIKITGIDEDASRGYTLKVYVENKSTEKTYTFDVIDASMNGVQDVPYFSAEVAPGERSNGSIVFPGLKFYGYDIGEITDIEMTFWVFESDNKKAGDVVNQTVHVYPLGEGNASVFDWELQEGNIVIVDNDEIKVIVIGYRENGRYGGYDVDLYIANKTDRELVFSVDNTSMNDFEMTSTVWGAYVGEGNGMFSSINFWDTDFEENEITSVEKIEFTLSVRNNEMFAEDFYKESITLLP